MEANVQAARDAYGKEEATHVSPFDVGGTQHGIEPNASITVEGSPPTASNAQALQTSSMRGTASELRSRSEPPPSATGSPRSSNLRGTILRAQHEPPRPEQHTMHKDDDSDMSSEGKLELIHHIVLNDHSPTLYEHDLAINTLQNKMSQILGHDIPHQNLLRKQRYSLAHGEADSPVVAPNDEVKDVPEDAPKGSPPSATNVIDFHTPREEMAEFDKRLGAQANTIWDVQQDLTQHGSLELKDDPHKMGKLSIELFEMGLKLDNFTKNISEEMVQIRMQQSIQATQISDFEKHMEVFLQDVGKLIQPVLQKPPGITELPEVVDCVIDDGLQASSLPNSAPAGFSSSPLGAVQQPFQYARAQSQQQTPASIYQMPQGPWDPNKWQIKAKLVTPISKFDGTAIQYRAWKDAVINHLVLGQHGWGCILENLQHERHPLTRARLSHMFVFPRRPRGLWAPSHKPLGFPDHGVLRGLERRQESLGSRV